MDTISNQTCTKCQNCGEWTNYAGDGQHVARMERIARYERALTRHRDDEMNAKDVEDVLAATTEATRLERARCLQAVADEAELPGEMPDEMWDYLDGDRDAMQMALRMAVRQTKEGIRERINAV